MTALFIEVALKSSILLVIVATAHALVYRRTSAATRHLVWMLAVGGLLLLPLLSAALPRWNLPIRVASMQAPDSAPPGSPAKQSATTNVSDVGVSVASPAAAAADGDSPSASTASSVAWAAMLLPVLYALGVLLFSSRLVAERRIAQRLVRDATAVSDPAWIRLLVECARQVGVEHPVRLLRSREHTMPMAMGIRVPTIIVPAVADTWDDDRRRAVLLHELAHVLRHDCLTQMLSAVACALYWVHPGAWWVARRLRAERELASDDLALAAGAHPRDYASHLLEIAYTCNGHRAPVLVVSMASSRSLEGRMLAILDPARNRTTPTRRSRFASVAIAIALLVPVAAATAVAVPASLDSGLASSPAGPSPRIASSEASQVEAASPVARGEGPGTWEIRPTERARLVYLRLAESSHSSSGSTIPIERLDGLSPGLLSGAGGTAQFSLRRDAGTFAFDGQFRSGVGAGTYSFAPSASFSVQLMQRGFSRPTPADQYLLARGDIGMAFVDELTTQGYARPDLSQLLRTASHGVSLDYLREMGRLGYHLGSVEALVKIADHGVDPQYVRDLRAQGFASLTADDLVRARDHGVDPEYIKALRDLGYAQLSLEALVRARDHGIDPEYVSALRTFGFRLTLEELIKTRDHGVDRDYIKGLGDLGYAQLSIEALVRARDHGVDPSYIKSLRDLGYPKLTLETLVRARDHGVDPAYIRGMTALGYERLPLESLIRLRDHGVTPDYVQELKRDGHNGLTVDELVRRRDGGVAGGSVGPSLHSVDLRGWLKGLVMRWWND